MAIDFKNFVNVVQHVTAARYPVLMRGRHGIGKSQVVYQLGKALALPVVERRASQMTEGDLIGLPSVNAANNTTNWNPPNWFKYACQNPCILFFDEVDRATTEVRQGLFELTDSRKLNGHKLHEEVLIFAAVNGGVHGANYQVSDMDPAELDRYTVFDLEPTVEDWLSWGKDNVAQVVWDFINQNRQHLEHNGDVEPNKVYPSRRSWDRFNKTVSKSGLLEQASPMLYQLAAAFIGMEAAVSFNDFVQNYERQVTVDDVLTGKATKLTNGFKDIEHVALVEKIENSDRLKQPLNQTEAQNLFAYMVVLPSEAFMKLWSVIGKQNQDNAILMHGQKLSDGRTFKALLVEMLTGKKA
jgi:midasin (ATPase involved in ribosome maturation)